MEDKNKSNDDWKRLEFYNGEVSREQEYYWTRFSAFAVLQAGLFVLFGSSVENQKLLSGVGIGLGLVWIYVQGASLWYVNRLKPDLTKIVELLEINYPPHFYSQKFFSTTDVALLVPLGLTVFWGHRFLGCDCICQFECDGLLLLCGYYMVIKIATANKTSGSSPSKPTEAKQ
jgi:hypothetical protein